MDELFFPLSGVLVDAQDLKSPKARSLALALDHDLAEYASLVECRTLNDREVVVLDAEVEVPQIRAHNIQEVERIAVIFDKADSSYPEVLALRSDFPEVPHLNLREKAVPKSLCLYDERYDDIKMRWTPQRFVARVRDWLSLTSRGILHQEDQPLEPLLFGVSDCVVLPHDLFTSPHKQLQSPFYLFARKSKSGDFFYFAQREKPEAGSKSFSATASIHVCQPQVHGIIRQKPNILSELADFARTGGIDLIAELKTLLREWKKEPSPDAEILNSHLVIILLLPKLREYVSDSPEAMEVRAFFCSDTVKVIGEKLGVWSLFEGKIGTIIGSEKPVQSDSIGVELLNSSFHFNREMAATLNGYPRPVDVSISAVGVGALGSHVVTNLFRGGFGNWTIIDNDKLMPHNLGRHVLNNQVGFEKSAAMAAFLESIIRGTGKVKGIPADVMFPGKYAGEIKAALERAEIILDMSASVSTARFLSLNVEGSARRVSLFMNPSGQDLVLLAEDKGRKVRLDQLEMQHYRAIATDDALSGHFQPTEGRRRYGQSCRDVTSTLSQDYVALHSAVGSRAIRETSSAPEARISVWRADSKGNVKKSDIPVSAGIQFERGKWLVCTDEHLLRKLSGYRAAKLPKETGGVLLGSFDMERKIAYVVDTLPSPPDSVEWPALYIRGARGLKAAVDSISEKTDGMLEYVGEWHSHPVSCPPIPSSDDLQVFAWLTARMEKEGLPPLMLIISDTDYGCFVSQICGEPILSLPE